MKTTRIRIILLATVLALAAGGVLAGTKGTLKGKVTAGGKALAGATVLVKEVGLTAVTSKAGTFSLAVPAPATYTVICSKPGFATMSRKVKVTAGGTAGASFAMVPISKNDKDEAEVRSKAEEKRRVRVKTTVSKKKSKTWGAGDLTTGGAIGFGEAGVVGSTFGSGSGGLGRIAPTSPSPAVTAGPGRRPPKPIRRGEPIHSTPREHDTESYDKITDNPFKSASKDPLSTFSIDVDTASYANMRRFINMSRLPPLDAVRIEEMVNYFTYDYPDPKGKHPFSVTTEISSAPWNSKHRLAMIGLQGKRIDTKKLPPFNLVFLLDVSGSMSSPNKLPLLKAAFKLLVNQMRPQDKVAIVVYAGAAGLVLPPTSGKDKDKILAALNKLQAGGSTAGGAGIKLAYKIAKDNLVRGGNNRVILATDGDFNVGASSDSAMVRLIEKKRKLGIFLTVLGFGMGNYKDNKMEKLADKGNGNYAYIDSILEAKKVLVQQMGGTLFTIAKDVKLQIEFNPAKVKAYRLIGYENRILAHQDFNDDKKDAGEMGAGHSVTAFYEIIPAGSKEEVPGIDELKYQKTVVTDAAKKSDELMTVKLRYKPPKKDKSKLIVHPVKDQGTDFRKATSRFRFATAVVEMGLLMRNSPFKANATFESLIARAKATMGDDPNGYRFEFIQLAKKAETLKKVNKK